MSMPHTLHAKARIPRLRGYPGMHVPGMTIAPRRAILRRPYGWLLILLLLASLALFYSVSASA